MKIKFDKKAKKKIKIHYDINGYYIFRNILPKKLIRESLLEIDFILKSQWKIYFKSSYPGKDKALPKLFKRNKNYRKFLYDILNKRMLAPMNYPNLEVIKKICKIVRIKTPTFQMAANRFHIPGENIFVTGTHQDIGIMKTHNSITMWLPLVKTNQKNGSIKIWKKSHLENVLVPDGPDYRGHTWINKKILDKYEEVWEQFSPGDLIIFHTKLIHSSTPNTSTNCRWAVIFRFDDLSDNKYFDLEKSPLSIGYTMKSDPKRFTGFIPKK